MDIFIHILAILAHLVAMIMGLIILHSYKPEFTTTGPIFKNGLSVVEVSYLAIVLSTLLAPVSVYHLVNQLVSLQYFSDINVWDGAYWAGLGLLLCLFHVLTKHLMGRVRYGYGGNRRLV